jgi:hypothetical protein
VKELLRKTCRHKEEAISHDIIQVIASRKLHWTGHVEFKGMMVIHNTTNSDWMRHVSHMIDIINAHM